MPSTVEMLVPPTPVDVLQQVAQPGITIGSRSGKWQGLAAGATGHQQRLVEHGAVITAQQRTQSVGDAEQPPLGLFVAAILDVLRHVA